MSDRLDVHSMNARGRLRTLCITALTLTLAACGNSSGLACEGSGEVSGSFKETNAGALEFSHGVAWGDDSSGYTVLFTDDAPLAEAVRASVDPATESAIIASMFNKLVVTYNFGPDHEYRQFATFGASTSSGSSGADVGGIAVSDNGCVRGDAALESYGAGQFELPLHRIDNGPMALESDSRSPERQSRQRVKEQQARADAERLAATPIHAWRDARARLDQANPAAALQAIGLSVPAAASLATDKRALAVLDRMRHQCPDPTTATLDEYGDVVGPAISASGVTLSATGIAKVEQSGAVIGNCYVMKRDGQFIDQCWPLSEDCSAAPLWKE